MTFPMILLHAPTRDGLKYIRRLFNRDIRVADLRRQPYRLNTQDKLNDASRIKLKNQYSCFSKFTD